MTTLIIKSSIIENITHNCVEIRLRTLEQVALKLRRALIHNVNVDFKSNELFKQLIRWFGYRPVQAPLEVLSLIQLLIENPKYNCRIIRHIGAERISKEFVKIQCILKGHKDEVMSNEKIKTIIKLVNKDSENTTDDEIIDCMNSLHLEPIKGEFKQSATDYAALKFLVDILDNSSIFDIEVVNALQHLLIILSDYPIEYMFQPPFIFQNLLKFYDERQWVTLPCSLIKCAANTLLEFLRVLNKYMKQKQKSLAHFVPKRSTDSSTKNENDEYVNTFDMNEALNIIFDASLAHLDVQISHGHILPEVWEVIYTTIRLYKDFQLNVKDNSICQLLALMRKIQISLHDNENCVRYRLRQIQILLLFQDLVKLCLCRKPVTKTHIFMPILKDYLFKSIFVERYQQLRHQLVSSDKTLEENLKILDNYENAFKAGIAIFRESNSNSNLCKPNFNKYLVLCPILNKFKSKWLIDQIFDDIVRFIHLYGSNTELYFEAKSLLQKLLKLSYLPLKEYVYEKLIMAFKHHIGCLMSGEHYSSECSNSTLLESNIVGVPLSTELLMHLLHEICESENERIKSNCIDFLTLLLRSENLFDNHWKNFIPELKPVLPLLNCCTSSIEMIRILIKFYDPDCQILPYNSIIQGNICFLFHPDAERRSEALTRLIYMLNSATDVNKFYPHILEINESIPDDLCYTTKPKQYSNVFISNIVDSEVSISPDAKCTLHNLCHLLDSTDVEPSIRKTTLAQINVLCSNWLVIEELCNMGAYYLILQALENAFRCDFYQDYPDAAVFAVSIIMKILLYDSSARCQLSETPNIYFLLLRTLMTFIKDIQVRLDASICLFLLLFPHQIVVTKNRVEAPLILGNLQLPLNLHLCSGLTSHISEEHEKLGAIFSNIEEETHYWRFVVANAYAGGFQHINMKIMDQQMSLDIDNELKLTRKDISWIRSSQPTLCVKRVLRSLSNVTEHERFIQAVIVIKQQLILSRYANINTFNDSMINELWNNISKYIQFFPDNETDLVIFEHVIDITLQCIRSDKISISNNLIESLEKDGQHALIIMLFRKEEIPLIIYYKICTLLTELIKGEGNINFGKQNKTFVSNLYDMVIEHIQKLFNNRDLHRIRCLLTLIVTLSSYDGLSMSDQTLFSNCRRLIHLSSAVKSFSQTGAQWHRDCLLCVILLCRQMEEMSTGFHVNDIMIKYFSGLCGHMDVEVRILAWSLLHAASESTIIKININEHNENSSIKKPNGSQFLLTQLEYLPGGFLACCLCTLLDVEEVVCIRLLAGQLFASLISKNSTLVEKAIDLLNRYYFFKSVNETTKSSQCILSENMPINFKSDSKGIANCGLISCYVRICFVVASRSTQFLNLLCTQSFMLRLYEVMKQADKSDVTSYINYHIMVANLCRLYTLCSSYNMAFVLQTLGRDNVWLQCFCEILFNDRHNTLEEKQYFGITIDMLRLLMVLLNDSSIFENINKFMIKMSDGFSKLFQKAFSMSLLGSSLQNTAMKLLSLMLIKSQTEVGKNKFSTILPVLEREILNENKQSDKNNDENKDACTDHIKHTVAETISITLSRLFIHVYPMQVCKFLTSPNDTQQQVVETLGLLLKVSQHAQHVALNIKLGFNVIKIYQYFFEEFGSVPCTTFLRRYGDAKKSSVIKNLILLFTFLLHWHSSQTIMVTDIKWAEEMNKVLLQVWPWLGHSAELKLIVLRLCAFLSERSFVICKQFANIFLSSFQHSILQLIIKNAVLETTKIKASTTECVLIIVNSLRVMMNCCSCVEGRSVLKKAHILDVIDLIHPFNPKSTRLKIDILLAWLQFWELFSRHEEGGQAYHLSNICRVINRQETNMEIRVILLQIIRNMAFLDKNRSILTTSNDFLCIATDIIAQPMEKSLNTLKSYEAQLLICVALWRLISGGIKYVALIRGTRLGKLLKGLQEMLQSKVDDNNLSDAEYLSQLLKVLNIISQIFQTF